MNPKPINTIGANIACDRAPGRRPRRPAATSAQRPGLGDQLLAHRGAPLAGQRPAAAISRSSTTPTGGPSSSRASHTGSPDSRAWRHGPAQLHERRPVPGPGGGLHRPLRAFLGGEQQHQDVEIGAQGVTEVGARLCRLAPAAPAGAMNQPTTAPTSSTHSGTRTGSGVPATAANAHSSGPSERRRTAPPVHESRRAPPAGGAAARDRRGLLVGQRRRR